MIDMKVLGRDTMSASWISACAKDRLDARVHAAAMHTFVRHVKNAAKLPHLRDANIYRP